MFAHEPSAPISPDDPRAVQAVLDELAARLRVVREEQRVDYLGIPPQLGSGMFEWYLELAFLLLLPATLLTFAFTTGPIAWSLLAGTALVGALVATLALPRARRMQRLSHEGVLVPLAIVAADARTRDPANEQMRTVYGVLSFDEELRRRPRVLVSIAERVRTELALESPAHGEVGDSARAAAARVRALGPPGPRRRVPDSLAPEGDVWFVELLLNQRLLPAGVLDTQLVLCLAHPTDGRARMAWIVPTPQLGGDGAVELCAAFPMTAGFVEAGEA